MNTSNSETIYSQALGVIRFWAGLVFLGCIYTHGCISPHPWKMPKSPMSTSKQQDPVLSLHKRGNEQTQVQRNLSNPHGLLPYWVIYAYAGGDRWTRVIFHKSAFFDGHCQVVAESRYRNVGYMWSHVNTYDSRIHRSERWVFSFKTFGAHQYITAMTRRSTHVFGISVR